MPHLTARSSAPRAVATLCVALLLPLTACGTSDEDLAAKVKALDSVSAVKVSEKKDGPRTVAITVDADASVEAVQQVFSTLKDDVNEDDTILVTLESAAPAELTSTGARVPDKAVVTTLLATPAEHTVQSFRADVGSRTKVDVGLTPVPFSAVVERGDALSEGSTFDEVVVHSGKRRYSTGPDTDAKLLKARADLVSEIDADFELIGVDVRGEGPLDLIVSPVSVNAVKVFLAQEADSRHGVVNLNP